MQKVVLPTGVARATGRIGGGGCDLLSGCITMRSQPSGPIGVVATTRPGRALVAPSALYRASFTSLKRFVLRLGRGARASAARSGNSRADGGDMAYAFAARGGRAAVDAAAPRHARRIADSTGAPVTSGARSSVEARARRGVEPALQV